jgi:hypothetical protein
MESYSVTDSVFSFASVQSTARKISEKEHRFWRIKKSLEGKMQF